MAIVAEAVAGAGFKAAALVAGSLCRACMREWRRVPNGMGRAVAAAKLVRAGNACHYPCRA